MFARKSMKLSFLVLITFVFFGFGFIPHFIAKKSELQRYYNTPNVVVIASTGRSGSTMLAQLVYKSAPSYTVLKTHLLPPASHFQGKILFIFSNPDKAAESALHVMLHNRWFGDLHFQHVETSDLMWLNNVGGANNQTEQDNLLSYDALGCYSHLDAWLCSKAIPCDFDSAQILAIKYENLWDNEVAEAIKGFLGIREFILPVKTERGYSTLTPLENAIRKRYNLGSDAAPRYQAYDAARTLWEQAPPFQYLKLL